MATETAARPLEVKAVLRHGRFSSYKAREVLDLIRGKSVAEARSILHFTERGCAVPILKVLDSAVANAGNNNDIPPDELFVSTCFADEGPTLRRFRPRARGRGTRIRKRTCHVTIVLARYGATELERNRLRDAGRRVAPADARASRARRVARSRGAAEETPAETTEVETDESVTDETVLEEMTTRVIETDAVETDAESTDDDVAEEPAAESAEDTDAEAPDESDATASDEKDA